ncbi:MAG: NAD-glutamate dehydrogenase domain-containing protein [Parachlamydiales bacterium]
MPVPFWEDLPHEEIMLAAHSLMGFDKQEFKASVNLGFAALALRLDSADADVAIFHEWRHYGIKHYRAYVSSEPLPFEGVTAHLRISVLYFTEAKETHLIPFSDESRQELKRRVQELDPQIGDGEFDHLLSGMNTRFLRSLDIDRLALALHMYFRAKTRDHCQYEVRYNEEWKERGLPSIQIMLAWKNTPKHDFLYRLAKMVRRHGLVMRKVNVTYIDPYTRESILIMALGIHGNFGEAAWEVADIGDFLKELATLKYFGGFPAIEETFVDSGLVRGNLGNLLKTVVYFVHQVLVHVDPYLYSFKNCEEAICRHPQLMVKWCAAFEGKFDPEKQDRAQAEQACYELEELIETLDTGHLDNDRRRKAVLHQAVHFIRYALKTNFYRNNKTALSFRFDPRYLDEAPFERPEKFPELPFGIFFVKGLHFIGFQIRFRDLARGGLRTVLPERPEDMWVEINRVFSECYNLAYTQQKKNKDIPEGGAKAIIFLKPYEALAEEMELLERELKRSGFSKEEADKKLAIYMQEQKEEYVLQTQRAFVNSLLTLVNCEPDGTLRAKHIVDYYREPEYLYLGPDERMGNQMIEWIAAHSKRYDYKPGISFISSKPGTGINHKQYGVTSLGVNVYMAETLRALNIEPESDRFTVKISGGPDGDVAGNQLYNLYKHYPKTAKVVALTDVSGTIRDPHGLSLEILAGLFKEGKSISHYPPQELSEGGLLLDRTRKKEESAYATLTLCWRKENGKLIEGWLSGSEMSRLFHRNVHQTPADIFIPAGGRPQTLNVYNWKEYLDKEGKPTSRAIVEGANLYLTPESRTALEERDVLIIKDSSANKCGVICSSYEVLYGLVLTEEEILDHKEELVEQILTLLAKRARDEARLLLTTHQETGIPLTFLSEETSRVINAYTDQLYAYLLTLDQLTEPMIRALLLYCPPLLREQYKERVIEALPDNHKRAIIACHVASNLVYKRGISWSPSLVDILPLIWQDPDICGLRQ